MKPIEALSLEDARLLRHLQAKHDSGRALTIGEQKAVADLVRKAAAGSNTPIPRTIQRHLKRIDKEAV